MERPGIVILQEQGGFVVRGGLGYMPKVFMSRQKAEILSAMIKNAANVGIDLVIALVLLALLCVLLGYGWMAASLD